MVVEDSKTLKIDSVWLGIEWKRVLSKLVFLLVLWGFLLVVVFPFYWMFISSVKVFADLFMVPNPAEGVHPVFFPTRFDFENTYRRALIELHFARYAVNSLIVSGISVVLTVAFGTLGAYAVARLTFKGKGFVSNAILAIYTVPGILLIIPLYVLITRAGLVNSLGGLVITYMAQTIPVALYMLAGYFKTIPVEIEEAALVDGYSRLGVIWRVTIPLSLPAIATVALYVFMITWNEFLFAFIILRDSDKYTLPIGLAHLHQMTHAGVWGQLMAGSVILTVPVIVLFLTFEKYLVQGLTGGGVKG
ncbi:MAG: carbohydrate ABC transporter permease [Candidatus Heimdallarchaeota archaeon]